jgi:3-hydroxyisobutyrate dehydrogenase/2-hydroxy-3-oxopropionate reductase
MKKVGFIGVGIMGRGMVKNLMKAGFELHIYARRPETAADIVKTGAILHNSIKDCVKDCDAVITIVGFPSDVEEVYFGKDNIFDSAKKGAYLIDMTTSSPKLAEKIYEIGKEKGFHVLDAPVTGGETGADEGTLSILAGGDKEDFDACTPLFKAMGTVVSYNGKAGFGQHIKLANQIMIACNVAGVCEALAYAKANGMDLLSVVDVIKTGSGSSRQLERLSPKLLAGDYTPGFFIKHFIKDMKLAKDGAEAFGLHLNVLEQVLNSYEDMAEAGKGDMGTQALITYYEKK